ncbi:MAG: TerB family tellurite resistance protein [Sulfuritalea sp.]|nr:TerB family tellurite resistance protein [Sulfuritalea sp.]
MRKYTIDSSQAKARLVTAALLADGGIDKAETDVLGRHSVVEQLGMSQDDFDKVVREFCEDMAQYASRSEGGELELSGETVDAMLDEIRSRDLRMVLLRTILEIVYADRRLSAGEAFLATRAMKRWNIQPFT